ncbi:hypothetical protein GCM10007320_09060 [Pseudorhodoferax aquiterrae]|uniref:Phage protein n=1 Tax=Pseudorhodoferax aquiterrae TaxID=747304 RepID=A0ABQ3FY20_9BURK|nr:hypothetical protein [Pseudorhodoferax aquiterrae]GHC72871.1 hypothetical protein GCM10007320_09060 [Pseudorhodoferax aquiterrae]
MAKETTDLAVLPPLESVRQVFTTAKGLDPYLAHIRAELDKFEGDVSTKKGRDAIASMAYKVAKGKTALDNLGKDLVAEMKKEPALVDAERKRMRDLLDLWKDEIRQPLTDWEKAEEARQQRHRDRIAEIQNAGRDLDGFDSDMLAHRLAEVEEIVVDEKYEEFTAEVAMVKDRAITALRTALAARVKHENEQAELTRLRQEAAAREQKDREERIAREAAERAQREAAEKAQAERDAATRREAEAAAAAERRELELRLAHEKAEREKAETLQRLQEAKAETERRAQQAVEEERRRAAAAKAEEEEAARRREADRTHKAQINRAALDAFVKGGLSEECARTAITLIAKRSIPAISITY